MNKFELRSIVWRSLEENNVALFPNWGRIPNFVGADEAAINLAESRAWKKADAVFCSPDSAQKPVRMLALEEGKLLVVASPKLRHGFLVFEPWRFEGKEFLAASIKNMLKFGKGCGFEPPEVDLLVVGSVAVNLFGERLGKGRGYADREIAIFETLYGIKPVATTVHDLQVLEQRFPQNEHDKKVDIIATPTRLIEVRHRYLVSGSASDL